MCLLPQKQIWTTCVEGQKCCVCGKEVESEGPRSNKNFETTTTSLWADDDYLWYHSECYSLFEEDI